MNGELFDPQGFIFFPYDWLFVLVIILGILGRTGFRTVKGVGKTTLIGLIVLCVCFFIFDLRSLFSDQQQYNAAMEAILSLLVLVGVIWVIRKFFIKNPKP
jgi:fucose 4-O-acetylase-like acetyltransferase